MRISSDVLEIQHSFLFVLERLWRASTIIFMLVSCLWLVPNFPYLFCFILRFIISKIEITSENQTERNANKVCFYTDRRNLRGLKIIKALMPKIGLTNAFKNLSNDLQLFQQNTPPKPAFPEWI